MVLLGETGDTFSAGTADTDRLVAYLLTTANSPRARRPEQETPAALAATAVATALILSNGGAHRQDAAAGGPPSADTKPPSSPRVARGSAGKPRRLPPLRGPLLSVPLQPAPTWEHGAGTEVPPDFDIAKAQFRERALKHCDPRFDVWSDVELTPTPRRKGVPPQCHLSPRAFFSEGLHRTPRCRVQSPR